MTETVRLAVTLARFDGGGIEHGRLRLIKSFLDRGIEVDLVVGQAIGELAARIPESVRLFEIAPSSRMMYFPGLIGYMLARRPSHILSAFDDVNVMVAIADWLLRTKTNYVLSNHNAYSQLRRRLRGWQAFKYAVQERLLKWAFSRAKAVVAASEGVARDLELALGLSANSIHVVYDPVIGFDFYDEVAESYVHQNMTLEPPDVLFVGRLADQKRVDVLLESLSLACKGGRRITLGIVGDGERLATLQALSDKLGVDSHVKWYGFLDNPLPLISCSKVLVLSSDFEGLGNVLVEAMACGTQVISTDCPYGPSEVLSGGTLGQLVPVEDSFALAEAIKRSLAREFWVDPDVLRQSAIRRFTVDAAAVAYLSFLGLV